MNKMFFAATEKKWPKAHEEWILILKNEGIKFTDPEFPTIYSPDGTPRTEEAIKNKTKVLGRKLDFIMELEKKIKNGESDKIINEGKRLNQVYAKKSLFQKKRTMESPSSNLSKKIKIERSIPITPIEKEQTEVIFLKVVKAFHSCEPLLEEKDYPYIHSMTLSQSHFMFHGDRQFKWDEYQYWYGALNDNIDLMWTFIVKKVETFFLVVEKKDFMALVSALNKKNPHHCMIHVPNHLFDLECINEFPWEAHELFDILPQEKNANTILTKVQNELQTIESFDDNSISDGKESEQVKENNKSQSEDERLLAQFKMFRDFMKNN